MGVLNLATAPVLESPRKANVPSGLVDGEPRIHGNFNSWMTNLIRDVERNLSCAG